MTVSPTAKAHGEEHAGVAQQACGLLTRNSPAHACFIFSVDNAVCKESCRRQCRRNRLLRSLPALPSVRIRTDSVL